MANTIDYRTLRARYLSVFGEACPLTTKAINNLWRETGEGSRARGSNVPLSVLERRAEQTLQAMRKLALPEPGRTGVDLGHGWLAFRLASGALILRRDASGQHVNLPRESVLLLEQIFCRFCGEDGNA
jgi:hypothetical protein